MTQILKGCFSEPEPIVRLPQCQRENREAEEYKQLVSNHRKAQQNTQCVETKHVHSAMYCIHKYDNDCVSWFFFHQCFGTLLNT